MVLAIGLSVYSQLAVQKEQAENPAPVAAAAGAQASLGTATGGAPASNQTTTGTNAAAGGAAIYAANCAGCHNAAGTGTPGTYPPLAGNETVTGDPKKVIHILLYGLTGPLEVNGQKYNNVMPPWKGTLKNADIAAVASYVRSSWGNKASAITEAEVAGVPK
jgi:mono/diheme cytochrome c family protein